MQKFEKKDKKNSFFDDSKLIRDRIKAEQRGDFPSQPARFSEKKTFLLFFFWFLTVFIAIFTVGTFFWPKILPKSALYAGSVSFFSGFILIFVVFYCKKKYGALIEFAVSTFVRTGIPLIAALVFFLTFDKILFNFTVLTLALFYLLLIPFEVWVLLPRLSKSENKPVEQGTNPPTPKL